MQITILTVGTRGDVQPYVALGLGLRRAGHAVRLATHGIFREFVAGCGLDFAPVEGNPQEVMSGAEGQEWLESGRNPIAFLRHGMKLLRPLLERMLTDSITACEGAEAIIFSTFAFGGYHVAEKMGVPCIGSALQPLARTRAFPNIQVHPRWKLGGAFNYLTHVLGEQAFWMMLKGPINEWRRDTLGLPPIGFGGPMRVVQQKRLPYLYGYSQHVVPKPPDWGEWLHVTGYWFLDGASDWQPPSDLRDFLSDGPTPVYVGFGSMTPRQAEFLTTTAIEALKRAGQRGILLTGWGGIGQSDLPDSVLKIDAVPHEWLFPRMAALVHHGGAGTTAEGLRAGVPSVVTPFFADQPFWGQRVADLGVGPAPIPQKQLTAGALAEAIRVAVTDADMRHRAAALGQKIRAEDGVARAVEAFHQHVTRISHGLHGPASIPARSGRRVNS